MIDYEAFVASGSKTPLAPVRFPFDHPWYILFSSGTTGEGVLHLDLLTFDIL
jgi:acyl-coenzyme A synthetase/AMP-(fatty) acid ligase